MKSLLVLSVVVAFTAAGCKRFPSRVSLTPQGRLERESRGLEPEVKGIITRSDPQHVYVKTSAGETPVARAQIADIDYPGNRERLIALLGIVAGVAIGAYGFHVMDCHNDENSGECALSGIGGLFVVIVGGGLVLTSVGYGLQATVDGGRSRDLVEAGAGAPPMTGSPGLTLRGSF